MWMNWRIVYMFAVLDRNDMLEKAKKGFDWLEKHGKDAQGRYYFALDEKGRSISTAHSVFSEAFVVMACCELYKKTEEDKYLEEAKRAMRVYLSRKDNPKGEFSKATEYTPKRQSLGFFMILANLGSVFKEVGVEDFKEQVTASVDTVMKNFWNDEYQIMFENINIDGTFDLDSSTGRHLNPGPSCFFPLLFFLIITQVMHWKVSGSLSTVVEDPKNSNIGFL